MSDEIDFEEDLSSLIQLINGHWEWNGPVNGRRPQPYIWKGRKTYVKRWLYETYHGIEIGRQRVYRKCDHPRCVHPEHLHVLTEREREQRRLYKQYRHWIQNPTLRKRGWALYFSDLERWDRQRAPQPISAGARLVLQLIRERKTFDQWVEEVSAALVEIECTSTVIA